jgi:hypothetical protein
MNARNYLPEEWDRIAPLSCEGSPRASLANIKKEESSEAQRANRAITNKKKRANERNYLCIVVYNYYYYPMNNYIASTERSE